MVQIRRGDPDVRFGCDAEPEIIGNARQLFSDSTCLLGSGTRSDHGWRDQGSRPIHRSGFYLQGAYRQYDSPNRFFQKLEWVARFDHVQFDGIDLKTTGINFGGNGQALNRQPLDRNRYTVGVNYWFYPSLALKLAYENYDELGVPSLRDNGFMSQIVWGF